MVSSYSGGFSEAAFTPLKAAGHPALVWLQQGTPWAEGPSAPSEAPTSLGSREAGHWVFCSHGSLAPAVFFWCNREEEKLKASDFQGCQNETSYQHEKKSAKS